MKKYFFIAIAILSASWATWTYSTSRNVHSIQVGSDGGLVVNVRGASGPQGLATANTQGLVPRYQRETVVLTNSGTSNISGTLYLERIGNTITITGAGVLTHDSVSVAESAVGVIPAAYQPSNAVSTLIGNNVSGQWLVSVGTTGIVTLSYRNHSGAALDRTSSGSSPNITYTTAP
jgi:hypothetical protein